MGASTAFGFTIEHKTDAGGVDAWLKAKHAEASGTEDVGKRKMTDEQMSNLIDWTIRWMEEWLQVVCPPPEKEFNHEEPSN